MIGYGASANLHDFFAYNAAGDVWSGAAFVAWNAANYLTYRVAAVENASSGKFIAATPASTDHYEMRLRGASLAASVVVWTERETIPRVTLVDTATTLTEEITGGVTVTPILINANNPRYSTKDLPPIAQYSAPTEIWTIVDGTGAAVNLAGKTLRFVVYTVAEEAEDCDEFDETLTPAFKYETDGAGLTVGGAGSNVITLAHSDANTATIGRFKYFLWNVTNNIVLAKGRMPIEPAVLDVV